MPQWYTNLSVISILTGGRCADEQRGFETLRGPLGGPQGLKKAHMAQKCFLFYPIVPQWYTDLSVIPI